jgi:phosphopantothenoylcysteine synthetase/decarboxylase
VARLGEDLETGFGADANEGVLLSASGASVKVPRGPKALVARAILDTIRDWRNG